MKRETKMRTVNRAAMLNLLGATLDADVETFKLDPTSMEARRAVDRAMLALSRTAVMPADDLNRIGADIPVSGWLDALSCTGSVRALSRTE